jgi:hypothetical protein
MIRRLAYAALLLGLAICLAPAGGMIWASWFAARHGCTLHEGFQNPCVVDGTDWGGTLYTAFVGGWLMLVTLPAAALLMLILLVMAVRDLRRHCRRKG